MSCRRAVTANSFWGLHMIVRIVAAVRANIVAWLALFVAMGGTSLAAKSYVISSTQQIKPSVLKKLKGRNGQPGAKGSPGAEGKAGPEGKVGPEGKAGPEGISGLSAAELATLKGILPHIVYVSSGVAGKPTIEFSGANVQIVSGSGKTNAAVNGEGNLIVGYDESPGLQTGSNNLVLGVGQSFTSYGGLVAGSGNTVSGAYSSVTGGSANHAGSAGTSVSGGYGNDAEGEGSSISGGESNTAIGPNASILGGFTDSAYGADSTIAGGQNNIASDSVSSVVGGCDNRAGAGIVPSENCSAGVESILGGYENKATLDDATVSGGEKNTASGFASSVLGGWKNTASGECAAIPAAPGSC